MNNNITRVAVLAMCLLFKLSCFGTGVPEGNAWMNASSIRENVSAVIEHVNGSGFLVITLPNGGTIREAMMPGTELWPRVCDVLQQGDSLAIVFDYDTNLRYKKYTYVDGVWMLKFTCNFSLLNLNRRGRLCLVELTTPERVRLTFVKSIGDFGWHRKRRVVQNGDAVELYEFKSMSEVLLNGAPYFLPEVK